MSWNLKRKKKFLRRLHFNKYLITLWEKVIKSKQVKIRETIDFTGFLSMLMWVQVPLPAVKRETLFNKKKRTELFIMPVSAVCFAAEERSVKIMKNK